MSDSENGIKIQIWVALILNLLFSVLHKRITEAEDFSTIIMIAAKNLSTYAGLEKLLLHSEVYFKTIFQKDSQNVQTELILSG